MNNDERESLRRKTRYFYDLQAIRIALGNRTEDPALYTVKVDEKTGKEKKTKKKATRSQMEVALQSLVTKLTVDADPSTEATPAPLNLDEEDRQFLLRQNYMMESLEADTLSRIKDVVETIPIYQQFLKGVKGCGITMSAVILSEMQMATPAEWSEIAPENVLTRTEYTLVDADNVSWNFYKVTVNHVTETKEGPVTSVRTRVYFKKGTELYRDVCPTVSAAWAYAGMTTDVETGKATRRQKGKRFNWNPLLKTKMLGVLGSCMIKASSPYRVHYDNRKHRTESAEWGTSKAHRHADANRVMVKMFIQDLWNAWRKLEGFPRPAPYSEAILGRIHGDHGGANVQKAPVAPTAKPAARKARGAAA